MARGGFRPGAGRPKKGEVAASKVLNGEVMAEDFGMTPLEYMLKVMNDTLADDARRDRMAVAAAPFVHARAADVAPGKKERQESAAKEAAASGGKFSPPAAPKLVVSNK